MYCCAQLVLKWGNHSGISGVVEATYFLFSSFFSLHAVFGPNIWPAPPSHLRIESDSPIRCNVAMKQLFWTLYCLAAQRRSRTHFLPSGSSESPAGSQGLAVKLRVSAKVWNFPPLVFSVDNSNFLFMKSNFDLKILVGGSRF